MFQRWGAEQLKACLTTVSWMVERRPESTGGCDTVKQVVDGLEGEEQELIHVVELDTYPVELLQDSDMRGF